VLDVVFEDDYLAIINKPAGIVVSGNKLMSVVNALPKNLKRSPLEDALKRPLPVHRLDFPTSGLLLIGKTTSAVTALGKLFEDKEIKKIYHAITIGEMKDKGNVKTAIEEKEAFSKYKVIERKVSGKYNGLNMIMLEPSTGRRHQLRIHMSSIGNPILGDKDYGKEGFILQGKGLFLHASMLEFMHPQTGDIISITQPLPNKFRKLFPEEPIATKEAEVKES
jgi:23S rRNA pseudouridine1911/1915/1917 synthase